MLHVCLRAWPKQFGRSSVTDEGHSTCMSFVKVGSESMLPLIADLMPKSATGCLVTILSILLAGTGFD